MLRRLKLQPEPIQIQYQPPPDGTYPPRLLALQEQDGRAYSVSIWMPEGEALVLIKDELAVQRDGVTCTLIPLNTLMSEVQINGQLMVINQTLKDGDFILWRKCRYIFQADPVKDRRERMQSADDWNEKYSIKLSRKLKRQVIIKDTDISLNSGKDTVRWEDICYIGYAHDGSTSISIELADRTLRDNFKGLNSEETTELIRWLFMAIPFDLSVNVLLGRLPLHEWLPDAYWAAATEKIYFPAQNNARVLPADEKIIFALQPRWKLYWGCIIQIALLGICGLIFILIITAIYIASASITAEKPFLDIWLPVLSRLLPNVIKGYLVLASVGFAGFWCLDWLRELDIRLRERALQRKRRHQEQKAANKNESSW